jgi:hypothetical protein
MNKIEAIGDTNLAWRRINYRKKDRVQYQQELNNARYEGAMRSDFRQPKVDEYTYDKLEIVRLKVEA